MKKSDMERERKFLVGKKPVDLSKFAHDTIDQGYIARSPEKTEIRIRKKGRAHTLTIKKGEGVERFEKEIPISLEDYKALWPLTKGKRLKKIRYNIPYEKHRIELDVYQGKLRGLKTAEVEFKNGADLKKFTPPDWFDFEITGDGRYSNWTLAVAGLPQKPASRRK